MARRPLTATGGRIIIIIIVITVYCYQTRFPFWRFMTAAPADFHYRVCARDDGRGHTVVPFGHDIPTLLRRIEWTKWLLVRPNRCETVFAFPRVYIDPLPSPHRS